MPLLFTRRLPTVYRQPPLFGVWHIVEAEDFFHQRLRLTAAEEADLARYKGLRRMEWLAVRYLLHLLTGNGERWALDKDAFAKPFFLNKNGLYCSLSHSKGLVGALLADIPSGCDLQVLTEKMPQFAPRFLHEDEAVFVRTFAADIQYDLQHVFWTAKESLYKAHGIKALDFRQHLRIEPFDWNAGSSETTGWICKQPPFQPYQMYFEKPTPRPGIPSFVWAVCLQSQPLTD